MLSRSSAASNVLVSSFVDDELATPFSHSLGLLPMSMSPHDTLCVSSSDPTVDCGLRVVES